MAKKTPPPRGPQRDLAGDLSVALVNTAGARPDNRQQGIESYADFVTWSQAVGTVSAPEGERLRRRAAERPKLAQAAFALVVESRTALAESFLAAQRQEPVDESHLEAFNRAFAESSLAPRLIVAESGGATLAWLGDEDALEGPLAPVLLSAFKVLTAAEGRPLVRQCAAPGCQPGYECHPFNRRPIRQGCWRDAEGDSRGATSPEPRPTPGMSGSRSTGGGRRGDRLVGDPPTPRRGWRWDGRWKRAFD